MCSGWKFLKPYGVALIGLYVFAVGLLLFIKVMTDLLPSLSWAEVFYGPALTLGSCYLLGCFVCWVEWRIRRKV
jgi:hypothetical protein